MPNLLDVLLDPISLCILGLYAVLIVWEAVFPARKLPRIKYWKIKGIVSFFLFFFLSTYLPLWYEQWLPTSQLLNLSNINVIAAGITGIILYEFGMYIWHRTMHKSNRLWRVFHQMHHSAERLDTYGAFYFSPFDMTGWILLSTICFSFIAGVPPQSITIILLVTTFLSIFQHANIKTPVWLGYIVQRPESHSVHHAKGIHAFNYSDLPVFDILFGTFRNPAKYVEETGFYTGASSKVKEMLLFKDVTLILFALTMIIGCKKENLHNDLTKKELLILNEWVLVAHGFDDNNNGILDASENLIQECQTDNSYIFHVDGTGLSLDNELSCDTPGTINFNWKLSENDTKIEIDFETLSIFHLDKSKLILVPQMPGLSVNYILSYEQS